MMMTGAALLMLFCVHLLVRWLIVMDRSEGVR